METVTTRRIVLRTDWGEYRQGDELVVLSVGESIAEGSVDALRAATLMELGLAADAEELETWRLEVTPEDYLKRWPRGPAADLAKKLVGDLDDVDDIDGDEEE